jgi:hypothetical protein
MSIVKDANKIVAVPYSDIVDYSCTEEYMSLRGEKRRKWFSDHAYMCLPLVIGNQYGFVVKSKHSFTAIWTGGEGIEATRVVVHNFDGDWKGQKIESHFGLGIITIQNSFTLRTPAGVNLMTINPPNHFIHGLGHMTAVIETDNLRRDFTFNLKMTKAGSRVDIKKGDWIGCFIPIPRYFVDSFDMVDAKDYLTREQIVAEHKCGDEFTNQRTGSDTKMPRGAGRRYFNGEDAFGNKFPDHQKRMKKEDI